MLASTNSLQDDIGAPKECKNSVDKCIGFQKLYGTGHPGIVFDGGLVTQVWGGGSNNIDLVYEKILRQVCTATVCAN